MSIRRTKPAPLPKPPATPQCQAVPDDTATIPEWRRDRYRRLRPTFDPMLCQRISSVEINGKHYCAPHAGQLALRKWLKGELVERSAEG